MDTYPIIINGKRAGELTVSREGLMTVFSAVMPDSGELLRLSVYGEGREGYLGLMSPDGRGGLTLTKRLSRHAMGGFPWEIDCAGPAGQLIEKPPAPPEEPPPLPRTEGEEDCLLWYSAPDGSLSAFDGKRLLIALPAAEVRPPRGAEGILRRINGREYVVFPR